MLKFTEDQHLYESIEPDGIQWRSVTSILHNFVEPFNKIEKAAKCSVRKPGKYKNKWYGTPPAQILEVWDRENKRSTDLGHWYHSKMETELLNRTDVNVYPTPLYNGIKIARDQRLIPGIYPEHIVYLQGASLCGQVDRVEVGEDWFEVEDHKTSKEIKLKAFETWEGPKKLLAPIQHLDDCEFNLYALQLSLYAYMILKHNPQFKLRKLTINHVQFKIKELDKWEYPILELDSNGEPIVDKIVKIELPFLLKEVQAIIKHIQL